MTNLNRYHGTVKLDNSFMYTRCYVKCPRLAPQFQLCRQRRASYHEVIIVLDDEEPPHHFMEFFSPPRVALKLRQRGLRAQYSFDIETGYDLLSFENRARALRLYQTHRPFFTMLSAPCTMYSKLQNLNLGKMSPEVRARRFQEAHCMLDYSMLIAKRQVETRRFFCHEHPRDASSWRRESVMELWQRDDVFLVTFDQCRVGLRTPSGDKPIKKPTTLMTNSSAIRNIFAPLQCNCSEEHATIQGSEMGYRLSTWCQVYTRQFVEALCLGVERELANNNGPFQ